MGVDLSAGMVEQAGRRGCYGRLVVGELVGFLEGEAREEAVVSCAASAAEAPGSCAGASGAEQQQQQQQRGYDLFVAADVFVYIGNLQPVMEAAGRVAAPGALLAFSCEALEKSAAWGPSSSGSGASRRASGSGQTGEGSGGEGSQAGGCGDGEGSSGGGSGRGGGTGGSGGVGCPGLRLLVTGRYAHSEAYLRDTGRAVGWGTVGVSQSVIRHNGGDPIWGHLVVMRWEGGTS